MILQSDLRIGNKLFTANCDNIVTVEEIKWTTVRVNYIRLDTGNPHVSLADYESFNGIPLNDEYLRMLGFGYDSKTFEYGLVDEDDGALFFLEPHTEAFNCSTVWYTTYQSEARVVLAYIKHVHQFQNLYYLITGKELEVNQLKIQNESSI